jgi:Mg2+ and Co2+ transporter CorA
MRNKVEDDLFTKFTLPVWIRTPHIRNKLMQDLEYFMKHNVIDIRDTILIPPPPNEGPSFDERLRIATKGKIDDFLEDEREAFKKIANERKPSKKHDINEKDHSLIQKLNIVAQAVKVEDPPMLPHDQNELYKQILENSNEFKSQDHRILIDEIYKVLYLNNENPTIYNVKFWSKHFKIQPAAIRNIFNYLAFPIVDPKNKSITKLLQFIDVDLLRNKEKLADMTIEDYKSYLEEDYYRRLEIEEKEKQLYLEAPTSMRDQFINNPVIQFEFGEEEQRGRFREKIMPVSKIEDIMETGDDIFKQLDEEIKGYVEQYQNERAKKKNHMKY